ncbi:CLIP-associating protein 1-A-like [Pollicipes pollicipes]|uniref:CLIP-associating protein 1-A-like n=1 Tax=Pollicipes pollicipes TaxID=41117 RepID=UPI001884B66A|nr:CLIP-associating protein 1-A-like [Pollicipes pollicipes]
MSKSGSNNSLTAPGESPSQSSLRSTSAIDLQAAPESAGQPERLAILPLSYATYTTAAASPVDSQDAGPAAAALRHTTLDGHLARARRRNRAAATGPAPAALRARRPSTGGWAGLGGTGRPGMSPQDPAAEPRRAESALADALATTRSRPARPCDDRSDESETSSVCSERSYDSAHRRDYAGGWSGVPYGQQSNRLRSVREPSGRDVSEVINLIASTEWSDRKEGLLSFRTVLRSNRMLTASELHRVTELFTKMFMDTHTKVFSIFLEAVQELVVQHHDDLADWLYILITRLLNKLGADLLGSVVQKLERTLDTVRVSFPAGMQLRCLCRFLLDQTQTPNTKVKAATLRYLRALLESMDPAEFAVDADLPLAVTKIIGWTSDQKSVETRNGAKAVIVAMFDLNTAEFTMLLSQLSKMYQDTASDIMQQHMRRRASVDQSAALMRARSPCSSNGGSPGPRGPARPRLAPSDAENLHPEEISRSLRRGPAEIPGGGLDGPDGTKRERDSTSQDSGISQMSLPLERRGSPAGRPPAAGEPPADEQALVASVRAELNLVLSAFTEMLRRDCVAPLFHPYIELVFVRVLDAHCEPSERDVVRAAEQCAAAMAGRLPPDSVVRVLNGLVQTGRYPVNQAAIKTLTRLVEQHNRELVLGFLPEIMPSLLKVTRVGVGAGRGRKDEGLMGRVCWAYDNSESSVRKAAVFCMVTIHTLCGEEAMQPHLASLNATKMKLLSLYIKRSQGSLESPTGQPGSIVADVERYIC